MSARLGLQAYPQTFLIAQDGTLMRRVTGSRDWSSADMRTLLEQIYRSRQGGRVSN